MALRNYMYAKHSKNTINVAADNVDDQELKQNIIASREKRKEERLKSRQRKKIHNFVNKSESCGSGRELILEDGSKICRNCADCSKKTSDKKEYTENSLNHVKPKVTIEFQEPLANEDYDMPIDQFQNTHIDSGFYEVEFTNSFKTTSA